MVGEDRSVGPAGHCMGAQNRAGRGDKEGSVPAAVYRGQVSAVCRLACVSTRYKVSDENRAGRGDKEGRVPAAVYRGQVSAVCRLACEVQVDAGTHGRYKIWCD